MITTTIVEGKKIAEEILSDLRVRVQNLRSEGIRPSLAVVLVGDDKPSQTYVRKKGEAAKRIGVTFFHFSYPSNISARDVIRAVEGILKERKPHGIILQLPVPEPLWPHAREIADTIPLDIDVDCLSHSALGRVMMNESRFIPPTPGAILHILKYYGVRLNGQEVCLVGRGDLIGRPLASLLTHEKVTITVCGRATSDLSRYTRNADIIVTAVGKKDLLTVDMVKEGVVVIDAGVCFEKGKLFGDVQFETVRHKASLITPVPGGVGPLTVAKLLENTVLSAERRFIQHSL